MSTLAVTKPVKCVFFTYEPPILNEHNSQMLFEQLACTPILSLQLFIRLNWYVLSPSRPPSANVKETYEPVGGADQPNATQPMDRSLLLTATLHFNRTSFG